MKKIYEIIHGMSESELQDTDIEEAELSEAEKSKMACAALQKINNERAKAQSAKRHKAPRRRMFALAAALVGVLTFGAVAYATDMFGLGDTTYLGDGVQTSSIEDSNQYKAMEEYREYLNALPEDEYAKLEEERRAKKATTNEGFNNNYLAPEKVKELCEKYDLKCEQKETIVDSADKMFAEAGLGNLLGDYEHASEDDYQYVCGDQGSLWMVGGAGTYFDFFCVPNDVFREITVGYYPDAEDTNVKQWDYYMKSGLVANCTMYRAIHGTNPYECYAVVIPTKKYVVTMNIADSAKGGDYKYSKKNLQKILEQFDFSSLR